MATGTSILLIALGAILAFAVDVSVSGLELDVVGWILMVVGAIGLVVSLFWIDRVSRPRTTRTVEEDHLR
jgi:hypothetical protein